MSEAGYEIDYGDVASTDFCVANPWAPNRPVILGGPINVNENTIYPFLTVERDFIKTRLSADLPILGICLRAQLIAAALGEKVFPS